MIILVIKGGWGDAVAEAARRKLEIKYMRITKHDEIVAHTPSRNLRAVMGWFNADHTPPFPPGALLYFNDRGDELCPRLRTKASGALSP